MTTKLQRLNRRREKDANRQATRREKMRESGRPETHAVDRAISEAVAYVIVQNHSEGDRRANVTLPMRDILLVASRILAHLGRHDPALATLAVFERTKARKSHLWTLPAPERPKRDDIGS